MTVTSCSRPMKPGSRKAEFDEKYIAKYTETFQIITDNPRQGPRSIITQASLIGPDPIPFRFAPYYDDFSAYCRSVHVTDGTDGAEWWATVIWDNQLDTTRDFEDPTARPPIVRLRFAQFQKATEKDPAGNLITTSAGQPIIPAIEIDQSRPIITVERNEATFPANTAIAYQDAINNDTFYGADPGTAKMQNIDVGEEQLENDVRFRKVTYEIHFDRDGWESPILNRGTWFFDSSNNLVKLTHGEEPVLLDADGKLLNGNGTAFTSESDVEDEESDDDSDTKGPDDATYQTPKRYKRLDFGPLNLEYSLLPIS